MLATELTCDRCQKFQVDYNWETHAGSGRVKMLGQPGAANYREHTRDARSPTACKLDRIGCPKGSPEQENEHVLSDKNRRMWAYYRMVKATQGRGMSEEAARDESVQRSFVILDNLTRQADQLRLAKVIANQLPTVAIPVVPKKK